MKKYIILAIVVIGVVASTFYIYNNYLSNNIQIEANNEYYNKLYNKELVGSDFATIINKTLDKNAQNEIEKNDKEYYLDNGTNSIIIEIKFKDSDKTFRIEDIAKSKIESFISLYSNIKFKCTKIEYHTKTNFVSYLYFEQI